MQEQNSSATKVYYIDNEGVSQSANIQEGETYSQAIRRLRQN